MQAEKKRNAVSIEANLPKASQKISITTKLLFNASVLYR